jgi:hypothetical protein
VKYFSNIVISCGDLLRSAQALRDPLQPVVKELLPPDLLAQPREVQLDHVQMRGGVVASPVQQLTDLIRREPELTQRPDLLEPGEVALTVQSVAGPAASGRAQQPHPIVVVQRADGQPRRTRQLTDRPAVALRLHSAAPPPARDRVATFEA